MAFEKTPPTWEAEGSEPPSSLKTSGWQASQKPPAAYFNWFWNRVSACLAELQSKLSNVDNTSDADKPISNATQTALNGKAAYSHKHAQSDITGLTDALAGKASSTHSHSQSDVTGLADALAGKASSSHTHEQSQITGLTDALNGKASSSHTHSASDINSGTLSSDRLPTVPVSKGGTGATTAANARNNLGITPANIGAASSDLSNVTDSVFKEKATSAGLGGNPVVAASSSDGVAYTATVNGITALTAGLTITIVPDKVSASKTPTLNVNSLGAKQIRRRLSNIVTSTQTGYSNTWLAANKPFMIVYDGTYWIAIGSEKPSANDIYGTLPIASGGTGADTAAGALENLGAAPAYTYGTDDITAGTSAIGTGKLYFVYE